MQATELPDQEGRLLWGNLEEGLRGAAQDAGLIPHSQPGGPAADDQLYWLVGDRGDHGLDPLIDLAGDLDALDSFCSQEAPEGILQPCNIRLWLDLLI